MNRWVQKEHMSNILQTSLVTIEFRVDKFMDFCIRDTYHNITVLHRSGLSPTYGLKLSLSNCLEKLTDVSKKNSF